jgi:hypothetical protein
LDHDRVILPDFGMRCRRRHRYEGTKMQAAIAALDAISGRVETVDIDQHLGPHDVELHQVEEGRPTGQVLCSRHRRGDAATVAFGHL